MRILNKLILVLDVFSDKDCATHWNKSLILVFFYCFFIEVIILFFFFLFGRVS